jgi:cobalt/nickel transport system permease protein
MHLIQGTLDSSTTLLTNGAGLIALGSVFYGVRHQLSVKQMPSLLALTCLVFLAQLVNCSIGLGFSIHLLGASLLAILFGPFAAMLSMASILILQAGFLGDGSYSTLGANFLNMGVVAPWVAYGIFRSMQGRRFPQMDAGQLGALAIASFASIMAASLSLSLMLGTPIMEVFLISCLWGLLETLIAVAVFALCVRNESRQFSFASRLALRPLALICLLTLCLVPFSSQQPDGLEHVLEISDLSVV